MVTWVVRSTCFRWQERGTGSVAARLTRSLRTNVVCGYGHVSAVGATVYTGLGVQRVPVLVLAHVCILLW